MIKIKPEKQSDKKEIIIHGYAPADLNIFARWIYTIVRLVYLLSTGVLLPLAILYSRSIGEFIHVSSVIGWILAFGAVIWTLMYIALEQYSYPVKLRGALIFCGGFFSNAWSGYTLSDLNIFYGAYQVVISALSAQFLFILFITIRSVYQKIKKSGEEKDLEWWYYIFLAGVVVSLGFLLYSLAGPVISEFAEERNLILLAVSGFFFLYQTFSDGVVLWRGSIFNKNVMAFELRNQLHDKWSAFSGLTIVISLLAALVAVLRDIS